MAQATTSAQPAVANAQDLNSSFPQVTTSEILGVLSDLGLNITADDIAKPSFAVTTKVFMAFIDSLSGTNQEWIEERSKMVNQLDYREIYPDGLYWRIFYRELNELFLASQLRDFTFSDMTRPQSKRFKRQLSALINFWRFKSDRLAEVEEIANEEGEREARRDELRKAVEIKRMRIAEIRAQREAEQPAVLALRRQNQASGDALVMLKLEQRKLMDDLDLLKKEKQELVQKQTDLAYQIQLASTEMRKLNGRIISSPKKLKGSLEQAHKQLSNDRLELAGEEKRARALEAKRDVMMALETELKACVSLLETLETEQNRIVDARAERDRLQDTIEQTQTQIRDVDTASSQVKRQIRSAEDRLVRLRRGFDEKRAAYQAKMEAANAALNDLNKARADMIEKAKAKARQTAELEAEFDKLMEEYDAFCNERQQERNHLCRLAEVYMINITRSREIPFDA